MKQFLTWTIIACSIVALAGISNTIAQEEESEEPSVFPVHITVCSYKDGKGQADLDAWFEKFNAWAGFTPSPDGYSAWTLTPYYYGPEQDFDFLWLGTSPTAAALGLGHDTWVHSAEIWPEFKKIANCVAKSNFATLNIKEPADVDSTTSVLRKCGSPMGIPVRSSPSEPSTSRRYRWPSATCSAVCRPG